MVFWNTDLTANFYQGMYGLDCGQPEGIKYFIKELGSSIATALKIIRIYVSKKINAHKIIHTY